MSCLTIEDADQSFYTVTYPRQDRERRPFRRSGNDRLYGDSGSDQLTGGLGQDHLFGGRGTDRIDAVDGKRDFVVRGPGRDVVEADPLDVTSGCEAVHRRRK
jgi:RTX calcium-binding nonapeptide repeat (4 copies)